MALITCYEKECGKKISDRAEFCPFCGFPIAEELKKISQRFESYPESPKLQQIELVEVFDNNGDKMVFEVVSRMEIDNVVYILITSFDEEEATGKKTVVQGTSADVFIMKEVDTNNGKALEPLTDIKLTEQVFDTFRKFDNGKHNFS